jgi:hypothetical protein
MSGALCTWGLYKLVGATHRKRTAVGGGDTTDPGARDDAERGHQRPLLLQLQEPDNSADDGDEGAKGRADVYEYPLANSDAAPTLAERARDAWAGWFAGGAGVKWASLPGVLTYYVVHRVWRLAPSVGAVIAISTYLVPLAASGPFWDIIDSGSQTWYAPDSRLHNLRAVLCSPLRMVACNAARA